MATIVKNLLSSQYELSDTKPRILIDGYDQLDIEIFLTLTQIADSTQLLADINAGTHIIVNNGTRDLSAGEAVRHIFRQPPTPVQSSTGRLEVTSTFTDGPNLGAFTRLRTSDPLTLFDSNRVESTHIDLFWTNKTVGGGDVTTNTNTSSTVLSVSGANGDRAVHQTKEYFKYEPGKSQLMYGSFNFKEQVANTTKRTGLFDDDNGIFIEDDGDNYYIVLRSNISGSPVDTRIAQADWNVDVMDGYGPSRVVVDFTKVQILTLDYEWLGAGRVRIGLVIDGQLYYMHQFLNANNINVSYMRTPNLPLRSEVICTGTSSATSMDVICESIMSEGGHQPFFLTRSIGSDISGVTVGQTLRPILSLRLKSSSIRNQIIPWKISMLSGTGANFRWAVILNPTITGGTGASWASVTNSVAEYDLSRDGSVSGGIELFSGFSSESVEMGQLDISSVLKLVADIDGTADELVVAVQTIANVSENIYSSIVWKEVI